MPSYRRHAPVQRLPDSWIQTAVGTAMSIQSGRTILGV